MGKQRFLIIAAVIVAVMLVVGLAWIYVYAPSGAEACSPFRQEVLAIGFKGDALFFGLLGGIIAAVLYSFMLRHQVFFPATDAKRMVSAAVGCAVLGLLLTVIDSIYGPECLRKALGPGSAIPETLPSIRSIAGLLVGNVWLAMWLDQLLLALVAVAMVRLYREMSLRYL